MRERQAGGRTDLRGRDILMRDRQTTVMREGSFMNAGYLQALDGVGYHKSGVTAMASASTGDPGPLMSATTTTRPLLDHHHSIV